MLPCARAPGTSPAAAKEEEQMRRSTWLAAAGFLILGIGQAAATVPSDHLKCFKVRDSLPSAVYTADLGGLVAEPGCFIKVPGQLLCIEATKTNVSPTPPDPNVTGPTAHRYMCYKTKCTKGTAPAQVQWHDQFGDRPVLPAVPSKLLCAPELRPQPPSCANPGDPGAACGTCAAGGFCFNHTGGGTACISAPSGSPVFCMSDFDCTTGQTCVSGPGFNACAPVCP
jgi:hypothetical protein